MDGRYMRGIAAIGPAAPTPIAPSAAQARPAGIKRADRPLGGEVDTYHDGPVTMTEADRFRDPGSADRRH